MANTCITSSVGFVITLTSFLLSFWLVSRNRPSIYLDDFNVSSLNETQDSTTNTTRIYFDLKIKNENYLVGVYYEDPLSLTFTYLPPTIITNTYLTTARYMYTIQGFYQGNGKTKHVQDFVDIENFVSLIDNHRKLGETYLPLTGASKVASFRVDFDANVKFKSIENKKSHLVARATLEVNCDTGIMVQNKSVKLEYSSGSNFWGVLQWLMFFALFGLFKLVFWVGFFLILALLAIVISTTVTVLS